MLESDHTPRGWRLTAPGQPACCDGHNTGVQRTRDNLVDGSRMGHQGGRDPKLYPGEEELCGNAKGSLIPFDGRSECSRGLWGMSMDECLSGNENEGVAPYEGKRTSRATTHNGTCSHRRARHPRGNRYDTSSGLPKFWKNLRWFGVRFQNSTSRPHWTVPDYTFAISVRRPLISHWFRGWNRDPGFDLES